MNWFTDSLLPISARRDSRRRFTRHSPATPPHERGDDEHGNGNRDQPVVPYAFDHLVPPYSPRNKRRSIGAYFPRTVNTGHGPIETTRLATLPTKNLASPVRP